MTDRFQVTHGDCLDRLRAMETDSVDAVITDPPYALGVAEWDTEQDVEAVLTECGRVAKEFVAYFGQMPTLTDWNQAAQGLGWHFCEHVAWIKRIAPQSYRLNRSHESIQVWAVGPARSFYSTSGPWEDIKLPMVYAQALNYESVDRYIKSLWKKIRGSTDSDRSGATPGHEAFERLNQTGSERSPRTANYTNVWSFLPSSYKRRNGHTHPTIKPLPIMKRLVEMLTPKGGTVCDPFAGSGSTGVACVRTGREFIGMEKEDRWCELARKRIQDAKNTPELFA